MKLEYIPNATALIRLYEFDAASAVRLHQLVLQLASGSPRLLLLHAVDGVEPVRDCRLTCKVGMRDEGVRENAGEFTCVLLPETWAQVAGLIEPFCAHAEAGSFQYLDQTGDVTLILSVDGGW